jgi:hypothetical protein
MLKLYWTAGLPLHYVAEDQSGNLWLIPITPMSAGAWSKRTPYRGYYTLVRCLESVERFYQPAERAA